MAPIPSTPIHFDHKTLLVAAETAYGSDDALTFAACRMWDVTATWLEVEEKELPYVLPYMGNRPAVFLKKRMKLTGKVALVGTGAAASGIPAVDPFLRACGAVRTQVAKTPAATIAAEAVASPGAQGAFTYTRDAAYTGVFDRTVTLTCTTGGGSGVAAFTIAAPAVEYLPAHNATGVTLTDGTPLALPGGAAITPLVEEPFTAGDSFTVALSAPGCHYRPLSNRNQHDSVALHILLPDGSAPGGQMRRFAMLGTRGQIKATGQVDDYPYFELELTSLFAPPAFAGSVEPDYSDWLDPVEISTANTPVCRLFGHDLVTESFGWDAGNDVGFVQRVGRRGVRINDRKSSATLKFEEPGLGEFDVLGIAAAHTRGAFLFQHGRDPGEAVRFSAPSVQLGKPTQSDSQKDLMTEASMRLLPVSGDDEWDWFFAG